MANQEAPRYSNDERLTEAQREQYDAAHHALQGRGGQGNAGGGAAGAAGISMILIGSIVVFMLYACFYPIAALVTLITGYIVSQAFGFFVPGVGWIAHFMVALPLCFGALMIFREHEWKLERKRGYMMARHVLRLVFTALIVSTTATFVMQGDRIRDGVSLEKSLSWMHFAIVAASLLIVHFVGRRLDRRTLANLEPAGAANAKQGWRPSPSRSRWQVPGMEAAPPALRKGLPTMTLVGGLFGAFLGYAAFETSVSTLVGLFAGCLGGALLMFLCWVITRPVGGLFDRLPLLWPVLMGAIIGAAVALRLAQADQGDMAAYLVPGLIGGALVLTVPYLLYAIVRRWTFRTA